MKHPALPSIALAVLASAAQVGCGQPSTVEGCIQKYAVGAGANDGSRAGVAFCRELHSPTLKPDRKKMIECVLPKLAAAQNDTAVRVLIHTCYSSPQT